MSAWKKYIDSYQATTNSGKLEFINYLYGYIAYCIGQDNDDEAEKYLNKAENLLEELEGKQYKMSMVYAYKSAFVGFKIGLSPYKAPFIGQESISFAEKSLAIDANNYFAYVQLGNISFYRPAIFGGSKKNAIKYYLKALELMENNSNLLKFNWNYLNLLANIINAYKEIEEYELAKNYCLKTLAIEPEFEWVKNELYPEILKKIGK